MKHNQKISTFTIAELLNALDWVESTRGNEEIKQEFREKLRAELLNRSKEELVDALMTLED